MTDKRASGGKVLVAAGGAAVIVMAVVAALQASPMMLWVAGAAALGLLAGFTTGLSQQTGVGLEFVKFLGAGLVIPLVGAVAVILNKTQSATETYSYSGTNLDKKVTLTQTEFPDKLSHPLAILGLFFSAFAIFAVVGVIAGSLLKKAGVIEVKFTR